MHTLLCGLKLYNQANACCKQTLSFDSCANIIASLRAANAFFLNKNSRQTY